MSREHLTALLDVDTTASPVSLVCAPAGYGKTTLVSTWADRPGDRHERRVAWVHLDDDDNDPVRLWSAILAGLESSGAAAARRLSRLSPPHTAVDQGFLAEFVDAIDQYDQPVWLVLDDAHRVRPGPAADGLDTLLHHLPGRLRLILACRFEPPLNALRQLRLAGRLQEIRSDRLAFARDEAVEILNSHEVRLSAEDMTMVLARTEGWPAGLRLAGMSLAGAPDVAAAVTAFSRDDRNVADYLLGEVLTRQSEPVRRFLLATSVCERLTAELADAVTGRPGAAAVLDNLERSNALVSRVGLGRTWYRYHSLLRSYLYAELQRQHAAQPLHRRAAAWLESEGDLPGAVHHTVAGADSDTAARLAEHHGVHLLVTGQAAVLRRLLAVLDRDKAVHPAPALELITVLAAIEHGDDVAARQSLALLDTVHYTDLRLRTLYAAVRLRASHPDELPAAMADAAPLLPAASGDTTLDLLLLAAHGTAALRIGHHDTAESSLTEANDLAQRTGHHHLNLHCLTHLAAVRCARGHFVDARRVAEQAISLARGHGWAGNASGADAYALAAAAAYHRMDRPAARDHAARAVQSLDASSTPPVQLLARTVAAVVRFDDGDRWAAQRDWQAAWRHLDGAPVNPAVVAAAALLELRMALALGEPDHAPQIIERLERLSGADGEICLVRATMNVRRGRPDIARRLLHPLITGALPHIIVTTVLHAHLMEAVLADAENEPERARQAVLAALELAAPHGAVRAFDDGGQPLRDVMIRHASQLGHHRSFVAEILAATAPDGAMLPEPLTPRERQMLSELPAMQTDAQIAENLTVSISTVKTHLRAVYRKLGVNCRRDAVTTARRHGLL